MTAVKHTRKVEKKDLLSYWSEVFVTCSLLAWVVRRKKSNFICTVALNMSCDTVAVVDVTLSLNDGTDKH